MEKEVLQLIKKSIKGNRRALEKVINIYFKDVLYFAASQVNMQEAEDIAQEVVISVFKKIHTLKEPEKFHPWLMKIVLNSSRYHMRKMKNINNYEIYTEEVEEELDNVEFLPNEYAENEELRKILMEEIEKLPDQQRVCILYHYLFHFQRKEIVELTNMTARQISNGLNWGKVTLKKRLEKRIGTSYAYSVIPAGSVPVLMQVLRADQIRMVNSEWFREIWKQVQYNMPKLSLPKGSSYIENLNIAKVVITTAGVVTAGVVSAAALRDTPKEIPQKTEKAVQETVEAPKEIEETILEEVVLPEIQTLVDMIGQEKADELERYVAESTDMESLETLIAEIGALQKDMAGDTDLTYKKYILEKQDKRLIIGTMRTAGTGEIKVLYWFGNTAENDMSITQIIIYFDR